MPRLFIVVTRPAASSLKIWKPIKRLIFVAERRRTIAGIM